MVFQIVMGVAGKGIRERTEGAGLGLKPRGDKFIGRPVGRHCARRLTL